MGAPEANLGGELSDDLPWQSTSLKLLAIPPQLAAASTTVPNHDVDSESCDEEAWQVQSH